jgi:Ala-tRNA(Pro) deacylase
MGMATTLQDFLESHKVTYQVIDHPHTNSSLRTAETAHIPGDQLAKPILLGDDDSYLLAVIPATHRLEIDRLNQILARSLVMIDEDEIASTFSDCETGAIPIVGEAYGVDTVLDAGLSHVDDIYFDSGDHKHLIHMHGDDFRTLMQHVPRVHVSHHL